MKDILVTEPSADYELIDSGEGEKLERYGNILIARPDSQALWAKSAPQNWKEASARFVSGKTSGKWNTLKEIPESWNISLSGITFTLNLTPFRHVGVFPEQSPQWSWLQEKIKNAGREISVLNLFAYTGGASLACAGAGAKVVHVDASQFAVDWAMKNRDASHMSAAPIRFIVDDVRKFIEREIKRGNKYDVILLDPPVYGKGSKNETWKLEEDLAPLLARLTQLLTSNPVAILLNGYASDYSHITYGNLLSDVTCHLQGNVSSGEMVIRESVSQKLLPCGIFAVWE